MSSIFLFIPHIVFLKPLFKARQFSAPIKGRSRCYASLHCEEYGHMRTWDIYNTGKMLHRCIKVLW